MSHSRSAGLAFRAESAASSIEVLNKNHFDGVVSVLHRAKSAWLKTDGGVLAVRPRVSPQTKRERADDYLFHLEVIDEEEVDLEYLEIEALELSVGDAVFALDGAVVHNEDGELRVSRPDRLFSKGHASVLTPRGVAMLRWEERGRTRRADISELSMDELVVIGDGPRDARRRARGATIEFHEPGRSAATEVFCIVETKPSRANNDEFTRFTLDVDDRSELVRLYRMLRFPSLLDRGSLDGDEVIALFERSRYLSLRETEDEGPSEAWCCPDFANDLSIDTVYRAEDTSLLGHVSVTRAYSRTWLGHQLATLKGHDQSADCRVALYQHFACAPLLYDGSDCFLLGYYDRHLRWHKLFFESFVDWVGDPGQAVVVGFDRLEPDESGGPRRLNEMPSNLEIREIERHELPAAVRLVRWHLPELAADALDINEEHLSAEALHPDYAARGVERGRHALGMFESGTLVAVALCETGSRHLSLFNLMNMAQLYTSPERPPSRLACAVLLERARRFYQERGTTDPVIVAPPQCFEHPSDAGLACKETMGCIIWSGESLVQYQSFLSYCFAKVGSRSLIRRAETTATSDP